MRRPGVEGRVLVALGAAAWIGLIFLQVKAWFH